MNITAITHLISDNFIPILLFIIVGTILITITLQKIIDSYESKRKVNNADNAYRSLLILSIDATYIALIIFAYFGDEIPEIANAIFILFSSTIVFTLQLYFKEVQKEQKKQIELDKGHKYIHHAININLKQCERHIEYWKLNKREDTEFNYKIWDNVHEFILKLDIDSGLIAELSKIQDLCKILNNSEKKFKEAQNDKKTANNEKIEKEIYSFINRLDRLLKKYYKDSDLIAETYFNRGTFSYTIKNYKEAIKYLDKSLKIGPEINYKYKDALTMKGTNLDRLKKYREAIVFFDKVLDIDPDNDYALINKGSALNKLKKYDEGIICCDKVLNIDPDNTIALNTKGYGLYGLKKYEKAIKVHKKALKLNSSEIFAYFGIGDSLFELGKYKEAIKYYDKILKIEKENKYALNSKKNCLSAS